TRHIGEHVWTRTTDSILPNGNQTGAIWEEAEAPKFMQRCSILRWMVPVDDTTTRTIGWRFFSERLDPRGQDRPDEVGYESIDFIGQTAGERSYEESQRQPGDFEAQVSQRPIAIHELENRASSDAGVARLRRLIRERIRMLAAGETPVQPTAGHLPYVSTFCQDSVVVWGNKPADEETLREHGRKTARAVLDSAGLPADEREAFVRTALE
ncbi:MAG: aromatic ring-hydroxylating dioxygenase subunit alpha, partial [Chromatiales bacterium]|nr:aromatic ring-hydroxylating dioxygenase subunit alpha [Chromatiales bacterium]